MKILPVVLVLCSAAACASLHRGAEAPSPGRDLLWSQAHDAYSRDSFRVAQALFQRLASEYPRTHEGHEARYYLGLLSLEPRGNLDLRAAEQNLAIYVAEDTLRSLHGFHGRDAGTLLRAIQQLRAPCGSRVPGLACDTTVVSRTVTVGGDVSAGPGAAEVARLRRELSARDDSIRDLHAELDRIRNTLAPRKPPE